MQDSFVDSCNMETVIGHKESRNRVEYVKKIIICLSFLIVAAAAKLLLSCPTLCDPETATR